MRETSRYPDMVNTSIIECMKHGMFQSFIFTSDGGIHGQMPLTWKNWHLQSKSKAIFLVFLDRQHSGSEALH